MAPLPCSEDNVVSGRNYHTAVNLIDKNLEKSYNIKVSHVRLSFSPRSEMTEENLKRLEHVFRKTVGSNGEIRLQDFKNIVSSKNVRKIRKIPHLPACIIEI